MKATSKIMLIEAGTEICSFPPIGLLHIASAIRDKHEVKIKDYSGNRLDEKQIKRDIKEFNPSIIGLRVLTGPGILRAIRISKIGKLLGKKIIWGGPHPTILPEQTLENPYIDAVCIGEGEYTINDLVKYLEGKIKKVLGAGIKEDGKIKIFPPQKKFMNFEHLPLPAWDLLEDIDKYFPDKNHNSLPLSTTRGCVFKCGFCHNSNKNVNCYLGPYRIAPPERAIEEYKFVQGLIKNKIDYLDVGEDLHLVSKDYARRFCEEVKKLKNPSLKWNTSTRYSMIDEEMVDMISKFNCKRILFGVESGSDRIQKMNSKIITLQHAKKIAGRLRSQGVFVTNAYIFGHPTETKNELKRTLKFIKEIPADENLIQLYRPMPATPYFELCLKEGKITNLPQSLEEWANFGVLGKDVNISRVPSKFLFSNFYRVNLIEQTKYTLNLILFYLREGQYNKAIRTVFNNRFTHKFQEMIKLR